MPSPYRRDRHLDGRGAWLAARGLAMATGLTAVAAGGLIASAIVDDLGPVDPGLLALAVLGGLLLFLAVGAVTLPVASPARREGVPPGCGIGLLVGAYALDYLARVLTAAEPLGPLSLFSCLDPPSVMRTGSLATSPPERGSIRTVPRGPGRAGGPSDSPPRR